MSAAADHEIRELDKALAADGQWVELQRLVGTQLIPVKVKVRAFITAYAANELIGGITQTDSKFIISPTEITRAGWPGPNNSKTPTAQDRRVPGPPNNPTDRFVVVGKPRTIAAAFPKYIDDVLIRIDGRITG